MARQPRHRRIDPAHAHGRCRHGRSAAPWVRGGQLRLGAAAILGIAALACAPFALWKQTVYLYPAVFAPDGYRIVFGENRGSQCGLYEADIETGASELLKEDGDRCLLTPTFSADGHRLAYIESERVGGPANVMFANADGTNAWMVAEGNNDDLTPRFLPDGREIVYLQSASPDRKHQWDVFAVELMTRRVRQLTHQAYYGVNGLSISPDGRQLLLSVYDEEGSYFIVSSIDSADHAIRRLRPEPFAHVSLATWLPDGRSLLFAGGVKRPGASHSDYSVYRLTLATGDVVPLTQFTGSFHGLHVSPDGKRAVILYQNKYQILDLETRHLSQVPLKLHR